MTSEPRQQALTLWLPVPSDDGPRIERELVQRGPSLRAALAAVPALHCGRLAFVPGRAPFEPGLLVETTFDGEAAEHGAALERELGPHRGLWGGRAGWVERSALRASAFYFAHRGLGVAAIHAGRELDRRVQRAVDLSARTPRELAERVRAAVAVDVSAPGTSCPGSARAFASLRERWLEVGLGALRAGAFEAVDAVRPEMEPASNEATDAPGPFAHVVPPKPGRARRELIALAGSVLDAVCADGRSPVFAALRLHAARWVVLRDGRWAFLAWHDGSSAALLDACVENASSAASLLWGQTEGFPRTRGLVFGGARRVAAFKRWASAYQLSTQIWYSAYPELSVTDVQRHRRLGELLAGAIDDARARELCALL